MKEYNWKRPWDAKGISAKIAVNVFGKVEKECGKLTASSLLEYSKDPKSPLHSLFQWDNEKASNQWRLQQARLVINNVQITVLSADKPKEISAYEIVKVEQGTSYKNITTFTKSDIEYVKEQTLKTLQQVSIKLQAYKQFDKIVCDLEGISNKLRKA